MIILDAARTSQLDEIANVITKKRVIEIFVISIVIFVVLFLLRRKYVMCYLVIDEGIYLYDFSFFSFKKFQITIQFCFIFFLSYTNLSYQLIVVFGKKSFDFYIYTVHVFCTCMIISILCGVMQVEYIHLISPTHQK